mgnify:CR=1 FL=1
MTYVVLHSFNNVVGTVVSRVSELGYASATLRTET